MVELSMSVLLKYYRGILNNTIQHQLNLTDNVTKFLLSIHLDAGNQEHQELVTCFNRVEPNRIDLPEQEQLPLPECVAERNVSISPCSEIQDDEEIGISNVKVHADTRIAFSPNVLNIPEREDFELKCKGNTRESFYMEIFCKVFFC